MPVGLTVAEGIRVDLGSTQMAIHVRKVGGFEHSRCSAVRAMESAATRSYFHG